ncbi:hypothetical protein GJ496_008922 [Pomphorhynchus laevis]|nr:hypothetical protein GJ496_008922 [Pomphorhynchus laevis]
MFLKIFQNIYRSGILTNSLRLSSQVALIDSDNATKNHLEAICNELNAPCKYIPISTTGQDDDSNFSKIYDQLCDLGVGLLLDANQKSIIRMRQKLGIFAQVINVIPKSHVDNRYSASELDFVIVRESAEGGLIGLENKVGNGITQSIKLITKEQTKKVAKLALAVAKERQRKKLTIVHKANIMKITDGYFLDICRDEAESWPAVKCESIIIDNCCMQLISNPKQFDVLVMPNDYGDIIAGIASGLCSNSILPSVLYSDKFTIFQPALCGSNFYGNMLTLAKMLENLKMVEESQRLIDAVNQMDGSLENAEFQILSILRAQNYK